MKKLIVVTAVAAVFAFPASALAGTFSGVVVGKSGANIAVASKSGAVRTLTTRAHARIGARVRVTGTSVRVTGFVRHARINAVVVKRVGNATLVAAGRSLLAIHSAGRRLSSLAGSGPATGAIVTSNVNIANGQLTQQTMHVVGQTGTVSVQAKVTAVGPGTITVLVNGQSFSIALPAGIQLPASVVGQFVTLNLDLAHGGPTARADDDDEAENEDQNDDQNDDQDNDEDDDRGGDDHGDDD